MMPEIRIHGDELAVRAAEADLRTFVREQFGVDPVAHAVEPEPGTRDPVAVAGLALAVPGAIVAAMDLAQRLELVPKLRRLIGLAEQQRANGVRLLIDVGDGMPRPLDGVTPEQILEAVARIGRES